MLPRLVATLLIVWPLTAGKASADASPPATPPSAPAPSTPTTAAAPAVPPASTTPPKAQQPEDSPSYVLGYSEGCASANLRYARQEHIKPGRDAKLYDSDNDYHNGWNHGYRKCEDKITPGGLSVPGNSVIM
jgi:hypothetical protein